jgi:hypothetical protein
VIKRMVQLVDSKMDRVNPQRGVAERQSWHLDDVSSEATIRGYVCLMKVLIIPSVLFGVIPFRLLSFVSTAHAKQNQQQDELCAMSPITVPGSSRREGCSSSGPQRPVYCSAWYWLSNPWQQLLYTALCQTCYAGTCAFTLYLVISVRLRGDVSKVHLDP